MFSFIQRREKDLTDLVKKLTKNVQIVLIREKFETKKEKQQNNPKKRDGRKRKQLTVAINAHFTDGQIVWAKMRGYSNWPARVRYIRNAFNF